MKNKSVLLVVLLTVLCVVAACGDGGSGSSGEASPPAGAGESPGAGSPAAGLLAESECREYASALAGFNPDPTNPTSAASFTEIADFMERVADDVPNEISDDFRTLGAAYRGFAEGSGNIDFTNPAAMAGVTPEQLQEMEAALKNLDTEEVRTAAANIESFIKQNCPQG